MANPTDGCRVDKSSGPTFLTTEWSSIWKPPYTKSTTANPLQMVVLWLKCNHNSTGHSGVVVTAFAPSLGGRCFNCDAGRHSKDF